MYLMGVDLIGVRISRGVYLRGVYVISIYYRRASHRHAHPIGGISQACVSKTCAFEPFRFSNLDFGKKSLHPTLLRLNPRFDPSKHQAMSIYRHANIDAKHSLLLCVQNVQAIHLW